MNVFSISDCVTNCTFARLLRTLAIISLLLVCSADPIATMSYGDPELTPLRLCLMGTPGDGASLNLKIKRSKSERIFN